LLATSAHGRNIARNLQDCSTVRPFVREDAPVIGLTHVRVIDGTGAAAAPIKRWSSPTAKTSP